MTNTQSDWIENSLTSYIKGKALSLFVLVPHQDDEINVAGSVIRLWRQAGCTVTVAFMANGDSVSQIKAETRIREALASLEVLGVSADHVIFLGYGECLQGKQADLYTTGRCGTPLTSLSGHKETWYAGSGHEYRWQKTGQHSPYTYADLLADIHDCLLDVRADVVISVDWDVHHDHRLLSLAFEEAMGQILAAPENTYRPLVYKGFAYGTAYYAPADFYHTNLASTKRPNSDPEYGRVYDTHNPIYRWQDRVRLPVPSDCWSQNLPANSQYQALQQHTSQHAADHAERIINSDKVFWQRRTDSLTYHATFTVSSGNPAPLYDFLIISPQDLFAIQTDFSQRRAWQPDDNDAERKVRCTLHQPQTVSQVVFYTDIVAEPSLRQVTLRLSNGYSQTFDKIQPWGRACVIDLEPQENISWLELDLTEYNGSMPGLSELEIFPSITPPKLPVLKIMVDNTFIYRAYIRSGQRAHFEAYGAEGPVVWQLVSGEACKLDENVLHTATNFTQAVIRCEDGKTGAYDQIVAVGCTDRELVCIWTRMLYRKVKSTLEKFRGAPYGFIRQFVKNLCKQIGVYTWIKELKKGTQA